MGKLEKTLLKLRQNFNEALTKHHRIVILQQYTFFVTLVLKKMSNNSKWQHYFITSTVNNIMNWIRTYGYSDDLAISLCNFLMYFLEQVLPDFSGTFTPMLPTVVNSLKYFHKNVNSVKEICIQILSFLIEKNCCYLMEAIEKIDSFPDTPDFKTIHNIHCNIKYGTSEVNLQKEIDLFLQNTDSSTGCDALVHLKDTLHKQKNALRRMFDKLEKQEKNIAGECNISLLHNLIATLVKMGHSTDEKVLTISIIVLENTLFSPYSILHYSRKVFY